MVDSVKDSVSDVQDMYGEITGDGTSYKEKNKKNALFIVAILSLLKEIIQKLINNEAIRAEMLEKLEAAIEEAHSAESSKAFWDKLREGVLAEVERQLKALNDKTAEKVSAKVVVLQQQLDHFFQQARTVSVLTARFEAEYPAIVDSIAAINADLTDIEAALEAPTTEPEELIALSEQIADIREQYVAVQGKFENWLKEFQEAARQLNAAAAAVADISAATPGITPPSVPSLDPVAPAPFAVVPSSTAPSPAPAVVMPASEIAPSAMPRAVARPVLTATPAPRPSLMMDDSTKRLLALFRLPATSFVSPQQKLDSLEKQLDDLGLRIGAAEKTIVSRATQHPELEIGNNPNGFASSRFILLKKPDDVASGKRRPSGPGGARDEEEERLATLFRQQTGFGIVPRR